ncbi:hybrid sensor histidine kinase/response regulator [Leisingera caerulea]|uniref:hybrid sensor histidine kinase/response regulator n=1 Tax=Leisingera caerulea TaxID=506591 RepID=UPI0021A43590|nr:PAS-domain containing protein [Leisingera caerulea]UWQ82829.1 PAS-domain containing protein [Leisingera caerulea]
MVHELIDPRDPPERQNQKLLKIVETLMRRAEQSSDASGEAYAQFQRAVMLEEEVRVRTRELEHALDLLNESNARLALANAETEAARANLANAIETVQEGFALFDAQDVLVMCNTRFGKHLADIYDLLRPGLKFADYVNLVATSAHLALPEGETAAGWEAYRIARHKDDHAVFNVMMAGNSWLQVSEHRTPDGGTVILQTDITDMMRLERQERERLLDDQSRVIKATLEHLDQGVCIFDAQNRLVGWNRRAGELLSMPAGKFQLGMLFATLYRQAAGSIRILGGTRLEEIEAWVASSAKRAPLSFEIGMGRDRILAVFAQQMPDKGFVISFTDVTAERAAVRTISQVNETLEQRVAERTLELEDALSEAERANASKSRFVAAASHDLLQPLSAAKLYVGSLEDDLQDPGFRDRAAKAGNALVAVERILGALLDISKLDSGLAAIDRTAISLGGMLDQLKDELEPVARLKGLGFRVVRSGAVVESDAAYLRRILQNLASNAVRYTDSGKVLIGVRQRRSRVLLEVRDTGPGIPTEHQDRVFQEFQRLNAKASPSDGMGLGLAIVERACRLLKHPLNLTSEVGRGTCFSVELPLSTAARAPSPLPAPGNGAAVPFENRIVVLIENDAGLRAALENTLDGWGLNVLPCASCAEASSLLQEIDIGPDAIIADYQLDDGALGTDAIAALRAQHGQVPACLVTANRSPDLAAACARLNAVLLHKPIDTGELRGFLGRALT